MKNILIYVESYDTNGSANGICTKNIVEELSVNNNVFVVTEKRGKSDYDFKEYGNVKIFKFWKNFPSYIREKFGAPKLYRFLWYINAILFLPFWPLTSPILINKFYSTFKKINKSNNIDLIISVHSSLEDCIVGKRIKKKNNNIKFYIYTLDALSGGYVQRMTKLKKYCLNRLNKWEDKIFPYADLILAMESHKYFYEKNSDRYKKYFSKIKYVDIPLLKKTNEKYTKNSKKVKIVYTGTLNFRYTNIEYLKKIILNMPNVEFEFYGFVQNGIPEIINNFPNAKYLGYLNEKEVAKIQSSADFLLNFGSNVPCMISGKIFSYFSTGRPIIHLYDSDLDPAIPYIERYPSAISIDERDSFEDNIAKIINFVRISFNTIPYENIIDIFPKNSPSYTCNLISLASENKSSN